MTTTRTAQTPALQAKVYRLTGVTRTAGSCDACAREITQRVFTVTHKITGETLDLGRRCAAKATGYAASAVERQAAVAARIAEVNRRQAIVAIEFPALAAAYEQDAASGVYSDAIALMNVAVTEDAFWGGRGTNRFGTWNEYLTHFGGR